MTKQEAIDKISECINKGTLAGKSLDTDTVEALYFCLGLIIQITN